MKNNDVILHIDTSNNKKTVVGLEINDIKKELAKESENWTSQQLLPLIEKILIDNKLKLSDLTGVTVHTGPGSYTGVRVGVTVANILSWYYKIPVNGRKKPAEPIYL
jgi:tRNA threonylcarbamoyladenosine biosynthesis protein TsaB